MLARVRPSAFAGLTRPASDSWERFSRAALARPVRSWLATVLVMAPLAILGLRSGFVQDVMAEMPEEVLRCRTSVGLPPSSISVAGAADRGAGFELRLEKLAGSGID